MEKRTELKIRRVDFICYSCGEGRMMYIQAHHMVPNHAPFKHACDKCGHIEKYGIKYPYQETYEAI